jgi:hypothetical protein
MQHTWKLWSGLRLFVLVVGSLAVAVSIFVFLVPHARGGISGTSEVKKLDLAYAPGSPTLNARVTLASGIGLTYETLDDEDADRLLKIAQIYAQQGVRLTVKVEENEIKGFQVSIR